MARPSSFSQETADLICQRIAEGESLRNICKDEEMPAMSTVFRWLSVEKEFQEQYARAREEQAEALADEIVGIADNAASPLLIDGVPLTGEDGNPVMVADTAAVKHAALRVDARKWVASKLKPKKYGDRITNEHIGANGGPIAYAEITQEKFAAIAKELADKV